jgi:hypothetical protein
MTHFSEHRLIFFAGPEAMGTGAEGNQQSRPREVRRDDTQQLIEILRSLRPRVEARQKAETGSRALDQQRLADLDAQIMSTDPLDNTTSLLQTFARADVMQYLRGGAIPLNLVNDLNRLNNMNVTLEEMRALQQAIVRAGLTERDLTLLQRLLGGERLTGQDEQDFTQTQNRLRRELTDRQGSILDTFAGLAVVPAEAQVRMRRVIPVAETMQYLRGGAVPQQLVNRLNDLEPSLNVTQQDVQELQRAVGQANLTPRDFTLLERLLGGIRRLTGQEEQDFKQTQDRLRRTLTDREGSILDTFAGLAIS